MAAGIYCNVVSVHGFRVADGGTRSADTFAPGLEELGYRVDIDSADYGRHGLILVRLAPRKTIERIAEAIAGADIVYTHSNGANYCHRALNLLDSTLDASKFVFHFSPALDTKFSVPAAVREMHVFHTRNDWAVRAAAFIPFHDWGAAGAFGYRGSDPRVTSHDFTGRSIGHSDWFRGTGPRVFPPVIDHLMKPHQAEGTTT